MQAVRLGLAANLRSVENCNVSAWLQVDPIMDCLSVAGIEDGEYKEGGFGQLTRDGGAAITIIIEGAVSLAGGLRAAQDRFESWVLWEVPEAIESDVRLTSRLNANGTVSADNEEACDSLAVREFRGYRRERLGTGTDEFLIGDWVVDLLL